MKKALSLITIVIVICGGAVLLQNTAVRQVVRIYLSTPQRYIGWVVSSGLRGSNQWHITSEKISVVGKPFGMLNPYSLGGGIVFSDYYPPGTKLYKIPGASESQAIAVQQPTGSYLLAVHQNSAPPTNSLVTCYGWVEPTKKHPPGHYKVISGGHVEVGRMIGSIGTDFMSIQIPGGKPVYAISGP